MSEFDNNEGFETVDNAETVETVDNVETVETAETVDNVETVETVETVEDVETADNTEGSYSTEYTQTEEYSQAAGGYEQVYTAQAAGGGSKGFAISSLVCGIVSLLCSCCGWLGITVSVAAVVLGIVSINKKEEGKGMAIAGIICGGIGLLIGIVSTIMGIALNGMDPDAITNYVEQLEETM